MVALCQFLPGPASSQVGIWYRNYKRWRRWRYYLIYRIYAPSVIILMLFSSLFTSSDTSFTWMQGLKLVAVAVVAQAIIGMGKKLTNTKTTIVLALFVLMLSLVIIFMYRLLHYQ
ncbi:chromate transporter [Staphylococcus coagulans]|uniref:chromate transporter n=2 Tax=Staphylococcus coagulans TaxID=74706 RepID=UPI003364F56D